MAGRDLVWFEMLVVEWWLKMCLLSMSICLYMRTRTGEHVSTNQIHVTPASTAAANKMLALLPGGRLINPIDWPFQGSSEYGCLYLQRPSMTRRGIQLVPGHVGVQRQARSYSFTLEASFFVRLLLSMQTLASLSGFGLTGRMDEVTPRESW